MPQIQRYRQQKWWKVKNDRNAKTQADRHHLSKNHSIFPLIYIGTGAKST